MVTHDVTDFDALAAQVAISKLEPGTVMIQSPRSARAVRDFLALHKDRFDLRLAEDLDLTQVERLVVVDVRRASRLRFISALLDRKRSGEQDIEIVVVDHHGEAEDEIPADRVLIEPVGAVTTLLVERLRAEQVSLDPVEATLLALGIYADTGSLTYRGTTARDIESAAWLAARGCSFDMVRRYLDAPMGQWQRQALARLLGSVGVATVRGARIGIATLVTDKRTNGLEEVVTKALSLHGLDALFGVFLRGSRVHVIGQARVPYLDIGEVMAALGGDGHVSAGSAVLEHDDADRARLDLLAALEAHAPRPRRVRHVMTTPVRTLDAALDMETAGERFLEWEVSGAPVVRDGEMVGIVSRRDLEDARRAGHLDRPVTGCMASRVESVGPDASIEEALDKVARADVGRLPVLERGHLLGITTRSDLLRHLYPG